MKRRTLLSLGVRGGMALGVARALHNTVIGYGHLGLGENLRTQDLDALAARGLHAPYGYDGEIDGHRVRIRRGAVSYARGDGDGDGDAEWARPDAEDTPRGVARFAEAVETIRSGDIRFRFSGVDRFFASVADGTLRPDIVALVRNRRRPRAAPGSVRAFAAADPADGHGLLEGLADGFQERTTYDVPRYVAGSIDDNVVPIEADLRAPFEPEIDLDSLLKLDEQIGLFCGEFTRLAIAAVHATPASEQSPPLYGVYVRNRRHKHAYNAFGTVLEGTDGLGFPMTFVDYTYTTLYDDVGIAGLTGADIDAYDRWHRADRLFW